MSHFPILFQCLWASIGVLPWYYGAGDSCEVCGIGNFSLPIARSVAFVYGVEYSESSVKRARTNAKSNNIHNCFFQSCDLAGKIIRTNHYVFTDIKVSLIIFSVFQMF